jgi:hypothetical protein
VAAPIGIHAKPSGFGAEITGLDISKPLSAETWRR